MRITSKRFYGIIALAVLVCFLGGYKVYRHEQSQNAQLRQLQSLEGRTDYLEQRLQQVTEYYNVQPEYRDDAYNYLAIGNSLTLVTSWGQGICATQPNSDYFGKVKQQLVTEHGDVVAYRINYSSWERMQNRSTALDLLDLLLSDKLNLVTIQLGENVIDTTHFEEDIETLITYVHTRSPKAKIVVVGDFWDKNRDKMRHEAATNKNVVFADISAIIGNKAYQSQEGTECKLPDGTVQFMRCQKQRKRILVIEGWTI